MLLIILKQRNVSLVNSAVIPVPISKQVISVIVILVREKIKKIIVFIRTLVNPMCHDWIRENVEI